MRFIADWYRRMKMKRLTLGQLKQKNPSLVEAVRREAREEIHAEIRRGKEETRRLKEKERQLKEQLNQRRNELAEEYRTLKAQKDRLILKAQLYDQKQLTKKKLKNMPSSLKVILEPLLFSCSSAEAMDKEIEKALNLYWVTHPTQVTVGLAEKKE